MKRNLLLGYLLVCVILVGLILTHNLSGDPGEGQPGFYRATSQSFEPIHPDQTQAAGGAAGTLEGSHDGSGGGAGGGGGLHTATATETPDPGVQATIEAFPTIED